MTPSETKVSSPKPIEGSEQSHTVSSGIVPDLQDLERNIQLASTGLPSTLNEGTRHLGQRLRGKQITADMEPINPTVVDPSGTGAKYQEEVFEAGEDIDKDTQVDTEVQSSPPNTDKPESSPVQDTDESTSNFSPDLKKFDNILPLTERQLVKYLRKVSRVLFNKLTEAQWTQHKEAAVSYIDLKDAIEGYYEENINHMEQTNKVIDAAMNSIDKNIIARGDLLNALNGVLKALKAIQDAVKEDPVLNKKVLRLQTTALTQKEHLASWAKSLTSMAWNLGPRMTAAESSQAEIKSKISSLRKDTLDIKSMMIEIYQSFKVSLQPSHAVCHKQHLLSLKGQQIEGKAIVTDDQPKDQRKLVPASKEIQAHLDKEEKIKKATEEAKMFKMTKTEVIKVVQEEAKKIGLDPKKIISAKAGEKFKKAQDAEHQVLKREHSQKAKRSMELRMKKNFEVHNPFKFRDFRITELDELGQIIEKKKKSIIKDLMTYLGKRYERLKEIPEELGIQSALPTPVPRQVASQSLRRKRKHMELEPEIKVPGLE
ncbi:hypothetical protein Tco_0620857 [Tanacetum coccineum]